MNPTVESPQRADIGKHQPNPTGYNSGQQWIKKGETQHMNKGRSAETATTVTKENQRNPADSQAEDPAALRKKTHTTDKTTDKKTDNRPEREKAGEQGDTKATDQTNPITNQRKAYVTILQASPKEDKKTQGSEDRGKTTEVSPIEPRGIGHKQGAYIEDMGLPNTIDNAAELSNLQLYRTVNYSEGIN